MHDYVLETEEGEDFTGKYFHMMVRMFCRIKKSILLTDTCCVSVQIDGFIYDTPEDRKMNGNDIGYRFESMILSESGEMIPNDRVSLVSKGLRYPGYITPGNIRLIGICPECRKSLCFKSCNFPMMQAEPVYSDDGTDVFTLYDLDGKLDRDIWEAEADGKTFRYHNNFRCRHCGGTYLDYTHSQAKSHFGLYGCVYLGHKVFSNDN